MPYYQSNTTAISNVCIVLTRQFAHPFLVSLWPVSMSCRFYHHIFYECSLYLLTITVGVRLHWTDIVCIWNVFPLSIINSGVLHFQTSNNSTIEKYRPSKIEDWTMMQRKLFVREAIIFGLFCISLRAISFPSILQMNIPSKQQKSAFFCAAFEMLALNFQSVINFTFEKH